MNATGTTSSAAIALNLSAPPARADGTVADHARAIAGELAVVDPHRDRDEPDLTGHRPAELTPVEVAA